jgi:alkylhydroperoxidase family enzyme
MRRWLVFGNHVLLKSTVPARKRELVFLRIGWLCESEYEWAQHIRIGKQSGLTDDEVHRIKVGPTATLRRNEYGAALARSGQAA